MVSVVAYTGGGLVTSAAVGGAIGAVGSVVLASAVPALSATVMCLSLATLVVLRETRLLALPLPQWRRQTSAVWARVLPLPIAAALWGLDLGLVFTTWLTYAGPWLLAALALFTAEIGFGAALMATYWLARALTVWLVPLVNRSGVDTDAYLEDSTTRAALYRHIHIVGAVWSVIVLLVIAADLVGHVNR